MTTPHTTAELMMLNVLQLEALSNEQWQYIKKIDAVLKLKELE